MLAAGCLVLGNMGTHENLLLLLCGVAIHISQQLQPGYIGDHKFATNIVPVAVINWIN